MGKWITIGEIVSTWGVSHSFIIKKLTDNKKRFKNINQILIQKENEEPEIVDVDEVIEKDDRVIIKLKIKPKEDLKNYIGRFLVIPEENLNKLKEDEYYIYQLIDLDVFDDKGKYLGKVKSFISNPKANDVLIIKNDKELAIPFIKEFIKEINLKESKIIVQNL